MAQNVRCGCLKVICLNHIKAVFYVVKPLINLWNFLSKQIYIENKLLCLYLKKKKNPVRI